MKFIAIVGTNASFSYNRKLLWYMKKHFTKEAQIEIVEITDLPLFSEDIREIPEGVQKIAEAIREADGLIFQRLNMIMRLLLL
ncbi:NADPH-dependent FMN reductase [Lactococcus lactis]|nr:NADPH-dependent FMN reductase [Lactococcus lactis]